LRAVPRQEVRIGPSQAAASAGDDGYSTFQINHLRLLSRLRHGLRSRDKFKFLFSESPYVCCISDIVMAIRLSIFTIE